MKSTSFVVILLTNALISLSAQPVKTGSRHQLIGVIEELNEKLQIQWNLWLTTEVNEDLEEVFRAIEMPKFLMLANAAMGESHIASQHGHKLMTIAQVIGEGVQQRESNRKQLESLVQGLLPTLQHGDFFWIYQNASEEDLLRFANSHWMLGYMNSLYFVNGYLYSYAPAPQIQVKQLEKVSAYWQRPPLRDFQHYPLTTAVVQHPPGCYRYTNRHGKIIATGTYWKPLELFAQTFNFELQEYAYNSFDYEAIVQAVTEQKVDIVPLGLYGWENLNRSRIMRHMNYFLIVPSPKLLSKEFYFSLPFRKELWIFNYLLLMGTSAVISYIVFRDNRLKRLDYLKTLLYIHNCLYFQCHFHVKVKGTILRILVIASIFYGFVLINLYQARLSSILTVNIYEPKIENLEDLRSTNLNFMASKSNIRHMKTLPDVPAIILERLKLADYNFLYKAMHDLNNSFVQGGLDSTLKFALFQQKYLSKPLMHKLDIVIYQTPVYFTVRYQLPYIETFNRFLGLLMSSGLIAKFLDESLWEGIYSGEIRFLRDENSAKGWLNCEYFKSPLFIWSHGMLLSFFVFVCEVLIHQYQIRRGN
ncbi:uncharacterized protein LOC106093256 [Stomoxys calcitrans]|uniref:uncharacterized protein LOC106093256 n=1 Tax=Stomoxys calcitrans TaxID=35570 RepID=UPI0027E2707C|nr:uncharacterized protein LOC106093256 [Stomoxys calcitrans]